MKTPDKLRRHFLQLAGLLGLGAATKAAHAIHTETHFDEKAKHHLVYQCNKADPQYIDSILFSCGEMLRKYGDDIELVIAVIGPGLHLLAKRPGRPISPMQQERVRSLNAYGVAFHACGNTMKSLHWTENDLVDFAKVVPIGVDDIMQLQQKGFAYMSW